MDETKWKGWFKENDQVQRAWLFAYLLKRKHKLTQTDYLSSRLSNWFGDNEASACQLLQSLDIKSAEDRELLKAMKNAWDKMERERKSHNIKRTYSFSPANLKAIKSQANMRKVTIEKHLNDLIVMAGEQLKQLLEQERTERKSYRVTNKTLRTQKTSLEDEKAKLQLSLETATQEQNRMGELIREQELKISELNRKNSDLEKALKSVKSEGSQKRSSLYSTTSKESPEQRLIRKKRSWSKNSGG